MPRSNKQKQKGVQVIDMQNLVCHYFCVKENLCDNAT